MQNILHKIAEKIKGRELLAVSAIFIVLTAIISFSLGYLYRAYSEKSVTNNAVRIEYPPYITERIHKGSESIVYEAPLGIKTPVLTEIEGESGDTLKQAIDATSGTFIASQNGSVYYPAGCKAGGRVQEENRVYFSSAAEAETLGYTLSKSCD